MEIFLYAIHESLTPPSGVGGILVQIPFLDKKPLQ